MSGGTSENDAGTAAAEEDPYDLHVGPDPAAMASAAPETASITTTGEGTTVDAVGIGPGNPGFLTPRGQRAISEADVVIGFETVVGYIADLTDAELCCCGYRDEEQALTRFANLVGTDSRGTAVLMGDPNFSGYQFLGKVEAVVDRPVRVVPGISALQVAASRARTPMENSCFVTLHRSGDLEPSLERLRSNVGDRHLLVLPRPYDWMPGDVAAMLRDAGADSTLEALVCENLTQDNEAIHRLTLDALARHAGGTAPDDSPYSDLSVLVIRAKSGDS